MTATDSLVAAAVRTTAATINAGGDELKSSFLERDMQKVLATELESAIAVRGLDLTVKPDRGLKLAEWPGVGRVDLSLLEGEGLPAAFLELKWGVGTLYNCVWDVAKMAVAVAGGQAARVFLVAGAPESDWTTVADGAELFDGGTWPAAYLLDRYAKWWKKWRVEVKTRPNSIPSQLETAVVTSAQMVIADKPWRLRAVEVLVESGTPSHAVPVFP